MFPDLPGLSTDCFLSEVSLVNTLAFGSLVFLGGDPGGDDVQELGNQEAQVPNARFTSKNLPVMRSIASIIPVSVCSF